MNAYELANLLNMTISEFERFVYVCDRFDTDLNDAANFPLDDSDIDPDDLYVLWDESELY